MNTIETFKEQIDHLLMENKILREENKKFNFILKKKYSGEDYFVRFVCDTIFSNNGTHNMAMEMNSIFEKLIDYHFNGKDYIFLKNFKGKNDGQF